MAEYIIAGPNSSQGNYTFRLDTSMYPFTDEDAFDLVDFLEARGYIVASTAEVNRRPYWTNDIPDPRP